jgi:hypothetical protein
VLAAVVSTPVAAFAQPTAPADPPIQVVLSGDVTVAKGTVVGEVVVFHGSVLIQGVVLGDVVVVDGPVTVAGQVSGSVVAVSGEVSLRPSAQVGEDVLAGEGVTLAPGSSVRGVIRQGVRFSFSGPLAALGGLRAPVAMAVSVLLTAVALLLLAPRGAERVAAAGRTRPVRSALTGVVAAAVLPAAAVLASITVVGLPFGLALLLGLAPLWLTGQGWSVWVVGRLAIAAPRSRAAALLAGGAIATAIGLVPVLNVLWWTLGSVFGVGAMLTAARLARSGEPSAGPERRGGKHRVGGRVAPAPPGVALPETQLGED